MPHVRRQLSKSVPTMLECRFHRCPKASFPHWTNLEYPVNLGHDVFGDGYISFDSLRELSAVLGKFSEALLSYGIEKPKVISCTVMREAKNRSLAAGPTEGTQWNECFCAGGQRRKGISLLGNCSEIGKC